MYRLEDWMFHFVNQGGRWGGEKKPNGGFWSLGRMDGKPETPFSLLWLCLHLKMFTHKFPWKLQIQFKGHRYRICSSNILYDPQKTNIILDLSLKSVCNPETPVNQHTAFQQVPTSYVCPVGLFPSFSYLE